MKQFVKFFKFFFPAIICIALFSCNGKDDPPDPVISITTQPVSATVTEGSISGNLTVAASVTEGATLAYQWFSNTSAVNTGGSAVSGATSASFAIPATLTAAGSPYYYFCEVSAAGAASVRSTVATITVIAPQATLISIAVTKQPDKTTYTVGEEFDPAGMEVTAMYSDQTTAKVNNSDLTFDYNFEAAGVNKTVVVKYQGKEDANSVKVTVVEPAPTLVSIAVTTLPTQTTYGIMEPFNPSGMAVTATYSDGSQQTISHDVLDFDYDFSTAGDDIIVTIIYKTESVNITVTVNMLVSIAVTMQPTKAVYEIGDEFDPAGMVITATYSDGSQQTISHDALDINYDFSTAGDDIIVTIIYKTESVGIICSVVAPGPPVIISHPIDVSAKMNESISFTVVATGAGTLNYQWYVYTLFPPSTWFWASLTGGNEATFNTTAYNIFSQCRCVVSNAYGSVTSNTATITIVAD